MLKTKSHKEIKIVSSTIFMYKFPELSNLSIHLMNPYKKDYKYQYP